MTYPIEANFDEILSSLKQHRRSIVTAPTGSGKSTVLPAKLLSTVQGEIWLIQPRRSAAILVAKRIADLLSVDCGDLAGYHIRFDRRISKQTRLIVMTEGMLLQRLHSNPLLEQVSLVILDEFHERSLNLDLALGFVSESVDANPDLHLLILSATLDPKPIFNYFNGECGIVHSAGRSFPVEVQYQKRPVQNRWKTMAQVIADCHNNQRNILVFLPGISEINKVNDLLGNQYSLKGLPLFGKMPIKEQQTLLQSRELGRIILSTNIAESSLTIHGITHVIDSGLQRISVESDGILKLKTVEISKANADQRSGRAGRTQAGYCQRIWTGEEQARRLAQGVPEALRSPLAGACLSILHWGTDPLQFNWLSPPADHQLERAIAQLRALGALDGKRLSTKGQHMARIPTSPSLAALILTGCKEATAIATLMQEGLPKDWSFGVDKTIQMLCQKHPTIPRHLSKSNQQLLRYAQNIPVLKSMPLTETLCRIFPERIGHRLEGMNVQCGSGRHRQLRESIPPCDWIFAVTVVGDNIYNALPLQKEDLLIQKQIVHRFDSKDDKVYCWAEESIGEIILSRQANTVDAHLASELLCKQATLQPMRALEINSNCQNLLNRLRFAAQSDSSLPTFNTWDNLLIELCKGRRSFSQLRAVNLFQSCLSSLTWNQRQSLDREAPQRIQLSKFKWSDILYPEDPNDLPVISNYIQRFFGVHQHPQLGGKPLMLHLLSPNGRIQQQCTDIVGFWQGSYAEIRKELRGRYPRHSWPEPKDLLPQKNDRKRKSR